MRCSTVSGLMLAAITIGEVVAGPTHAHIHKHLRNKKDVDWAALDWNAMGIDWVSAWAAGQKTAAPVPTPTPVAAPPPATTAAPVATTAAPSPEPVVAVQQSGSNSGALFNGVVGASNDRTSFGGSSAAQGSVGDFYVGNVGVPYGSNIIKVASAAGQQFTNTFVNTQSVGITVNIWQKVGPDGQPLSGSSLAPHETSLTFYLAPGAEQVVAFQDNTQIGWAQACGEIAQSGAFATTWGEANFVSTGSGYDVSAIMNPHNNNYAMTITSAEAPACTSSNTQNFWLTATDPVGDSNGSCFIAQSTANLRTLMGGTI